MIKKIFMEEKVSFYMFKKKLILVLIFGTDLFYIIIYLMINLC